LAVLVLAVAGIGGAPSASAATDPVVSASVSGSPFYPNGDSIRESVGLKVRLSASVTLSVAVVDFDGVVVKTMLADTARAAGTYRFTWRGRNAQKRIVPDGPYRFRVAATRGGTTWTHYALFTKAPKLIYAPRPGAIVVAVDPGHGDVYSEPTRQAADGTREAVVNLDIGLRLRDMLEGAGVRTTISRTRDQGANTPAWDRNGDGRVEYADELQARCDIANQGRADLFIAIHNNKAADTYVHGTATYYWPERPYAAQSLALAQIVQSSLVKRLSGFSAYKFREADRGLRTYDYFVLYQYNPPRQQRPTEMPAVLSEALFYSNPGDLAVLESPAGRQTIADGYYDAIQRYLAQRSYAVGYGAPTAPADVTAGGSVDYQIRVINKGQVGASDWKLEARYVADVTLYDGSPDAGVLLGSVPVPALGRGARSLVNMTLPAPPAGDWLVKFDVVRGDGSRLSELGSPMLQLPLSVTPGP
jgi:N-acetylmuramoyl-L-alanine amidase